MIKPRHTWSAALFEFSRLFLWPWNVAPCPGRLDRVSPHLLSPTVLLLLIWFGPPYPALTAAPETSPVTYTLEIVPLLERYCFSCHGHGKHKGDLALDSWKDEASALAAPKTWERVLQKLQAREM